MYISPHPRIESIPDSLDRGKSPPASVALACSHAISTPRRRFHASPEIGSGVGGVIYNAIFGYLDIVAGGPRLILGIAKIKQCAKVFVR